MDWLAEQYVCRLGACAIAVDKTNYKDCRFNKH